MKVFISRSSLDGKFTIFKHRPEQIVSLVEDPTPNHLLDITFFASVDEKDEILFSGWGGIDTLFPELSTIKRGTCVEVEYNNDAFRILHNE